MTSKQNLILWCLFLSVFGVPQAQENNNSKVPLVTVLKQLEQQYHLSFSYADATIANKDLIPPVKNLSRARLISYLESETHLVFETLNAISFAIRPTVFSDITKTQYLDEVLLTNYLTEGISLQSDGTSHINLTTFGILPGLIEPDVLQTIQALPGINSADERVSNLNIRGGTNDQNLILWDGVKMYQSGHFFGLISAFNPLLIDAVEVSKNGSSTQFSEGVSGIIHMKSSNKVSQEFKAGLGANMIAVDGFIQIPISKKLSVQFAGRRSLTDAFDTPTYKQYFKRIFRASNLNNPIETVITSNEDFYFRSEEHTSELQSRPHLVCRLLLEKKKKKTKKKKIKKKKRKKKKKIKELQTKSKQYRSLQI